MGKKFDPKDRFFRKAKAEGFRARSAYKLEEIARKHRLFRKKGRVLDLGAAPGGFMQVALQAVGARGLVVGVDLQDIADLGEGAVTLVADVFDGALFERLAEVYAGRYDVVMSDMAPATTGSAATDVPRSHALVQRAMEVAERVLKPGGSFVAKVFMGAGFEELQDELRPRFGKLKIERPEATRSRSRECFVVGTRFTS